MGELTDRVDIAEAEYKRLQTVLRDLIKECEAFSEAHAGCFSDLGDDVIVDPQDWAEFDIAVAKAKEEINE